MAAPVLDPDNVQLPAAVLAAPNDTTTFRLGPAGPTAATPSDHQPAAEPGHDAAQPVEERYHSPHVPRASRMTPPRGASPVSTLDESTSDSDPASRSLIASTGADHGDVAAGSFSDSDDARTEQSLPSQVTAWQR